MAINLGPLPTKKQNTINPLILGKTDPSLVAKSKFAPANPAATNPVIKTPAAQTFVNNQLSSQPKATIYAGGLQPNDPRNQYNTATGQLNPNYKAPATSFTAPQPTPSPIVPTPKPTPVVPEPTPEMPTPEPTPTNTAYDTARTKYTQAYTDYINSLKSSPEEDTAAKQLAAYRASYGAGMQDIEDKVIPMEFITGQQASLAKRAQLGEQNLLAGLSLAEQRKQRELQAQQANLGFLQSEAELARGEKGVEVGGSLVDPRTGKVIYSAPAKAAESFTLGEGQVRYDASGKPIATGPAKQETPSDKLATLKFNEDVRQFGLEYAQKERALALEKQKVEATSPAVSATNAITQINLVKNSLNNAERLAAASGRSGIRKTAEAWFVGSTDYTNLVAETNTLRTNVLTLATDPSIKKFFGPQMSNADVQLMTSAGTTLNPELQSPDNLKAEIGRLRNLITRMEKAVGQGTGTGDDQLLKQYGL